MLHPSSVSIKNSNTNPNLVYTKSPVKTLISLENEDTRFQQISKAAYYRALGRNFDGGDALQDWLIAEVEIDGKEINHS